MAGNSGQQGSANLLRRSVSGTPKDELDGGKIGSTEMKMKSDEDARLRQCSMQRWECPGRVRG